jgi:hypothetical protein
VLSPVKNHTWLRSKLLDGSDPLDYSASSVGRAGLDWQALSGTQACWRVPEKRMGALLPGCSFELPRFIMLEEEFR